MAGISDDVENLRVNRDDFLHALEEVRPLFGVAEEELEAVIQNGIIHYESNVDVSYWGAISLVLLDLSHSSGTLARWTTVCGTS